MTIIFDLIPILLIALCAILGRKRGFIRTFFGFFGSLIGFIVTSLYAPMLGKFVTETKCTACGNNRIVKLQSA